jgi:hypothetical protein
MFTPPVPGYVPPKGRQTDTLAIVSLVTGILSLPGAFCCMLVGIPLSLTAVVTGIISIVGMGNKPELEGKGLAIGGIACGAVGVVLLVVALVIGIGGGLLRGL